MDSLGVWVIAWITTPTRQLEQRAYTIHTPTLVFSLFQLAFNVFKRHFVQNIMTLTGIVAFSPVKLPDKISHAYRAELFGQSFKAHFANYCLVA